MSIELRVGEGHNEFGPKSLIWVKIDSPTVLSNVKAAIDTIGKMSDNRTKVTQAKVALAFRVIDELGDPTLRSHMTPESQMEVLKLIGEIPKLVQEESLTAEKMDRKKIAAAIAASIAIAIIVGSGGVGSPMALMAAKAALVAVI